MAHMKNQSNAYAQALDRGIFDMIPKSVFAAIAVSFGTSGGDRLDEATSAILNEWLVLYLNGIVPQKPPRSLLAKMGQPDPDDYDDYEPNV